MTKTKVYERIRELRQALGLSQTEFAYQAGISHSSLTKIEAGDNPATQKVINRIVARWGVPEAWLTTGKGEMKYSNAANTNTHPWKDEAWTLAKEQLIQKDEQLNTVTRALDRVTGFLNKIDPSVFLQPVRETGS